MTLYVFQRLARVSHNYHPEGGAIVIARDAAAAADLIEHTKHLEVTAEEWDQAIIFDGIATDEERVFIFPNAGCC